MLVDVMFVHRSYSLMVLFVYVVFVHKAYSLMIVFVHKWCRFLLVSENMVYIVVLYADDFALLAVVMGVVWKVDAKKCL